MEVYGHPLKVSGSNIGSCRRPAKYPDIVDPRQGLRRRAAVSELPLQIKNPRPLWNCGDVACLPSMRGDGGRLMLVVE